MELVQEEERNVNQKDEESKKLLEENEKFRKKLAFVNEKLRIYLQRVKENLKYRLEQENELLLLEQDQDRKAYQKLLKENHDLEQQVEFLQQKLALHVPGHSRSLSNASSGNGHIASNDLPSDDHNIDFGYESIKSTASSSTSYSRVETIDWNQQRTYSPPDGEISVRKSPLERNGPAHGPVDAGLVLKFLQKLKGADKENERLNRMNEDLERDNPENATRTQDLFKLQELEMENEKLKKDLGSLRKTVSEGNPVTAQKHLMVQFQALQEELERRREECIQLHSVLADNTKRMKNLETNYGRDVDIVNENGELVLAFEAQKKINRQLQDELQDKEKGWREQRNEWRAEIDKLQEEIQRLQKLFYLNLSKAPQTQTKAYMQNEITRMSGKNLVLQAKYDNMADERRNMPAICKKERDYEGMFAFKKEDISVIIRHLIIDLKPRIAVTLLPGLPAYILFMCIRHTDCVNDDDKVRSLLTGYLNAVKKVIKKRDDFDSSVLWLSNTLRLLHNMKQYSGDKPFQLENTPRQNEQCLRNFDLSKYRVVLSNVALWIFNSIVNNLKVRIQALIVPALLEHVSISGLDSKKPGRARSLSMGDEPESTHQMMDNLLLKLSSVHKILQYHSVNSEIIMQIFKQLFYFMCASAFNHFLLRNELCHWTKRMQIRYNVFDLEQWAIDQQLVTASEALHPLIQAAQLLQARKRDEDVESVCDMCNKLTSNQIVKILNLYTPADEFETRVPVSFIKKVQEKLAERNENTEQLLMDLRFSYPVRFTFNPSDIRLEDIEVPEVLHLPMLKKL